jgi:hypothetical protein
VVDGGIRLRPGAPAKVSLLTPAGPVPSPVLVDKSGGAKPPASPAASGAPAKP